MYKHSFINNYMKSICYVYEMEAILGNEIGIKKEEKMKLANDKSKKQQKNLFSNLNSNSVSTTAGTA